MLNFLLAASAMIQPVAVPTDDLDANMRCLAVATRMGAASEDAVRQTGTYMTMFYYGKVHDRASSGTLARSLHDQAGQLTAGSLTDETKFCMMKFMRANDDLKAMAVRADAIR